MQPWGPGKCQKLAEQGLFLPHLQGQNVAELCKTDAFQQLNPFPCYFSFFLQTQSFAATGFHVLVVQQEQERPWRGAWRDIRARKSKSQCPCHCCVQAGGRAGRALAFVGSKARRCPSTTGKKDGGLQITPCLLQSLCPLQSEVLLIGGCDNASSKLPD